MFSYSSPELIDAEVRYRRERVAHDWQLRDRGLATEGGAVGRRMRTAMAAVSGIVTSPGRHRHA